jgi:hypothetical protein
MSKTTGILISDFDGTLTRYDFFELVQCIIDLVIVYLLSLVGVDKTLEIGAA